MMIIETSIFTQRIKELMSDDEYKVLQEALVNRPDRGVIIQGPGGLRKVRWKARVKAEGLGLFITGLQRVSVSTCCMYTPRATRKT